MYTSTTITSMMKPRSAMGGESSTHGAVTDMYKILVGKSEWKRPHERLWESGVWVKYFTILTGWDTGSSSRGSLIYIDEIKINLKQIPLEVFAATCVSRDLLCSLIDFLYLNQTASKALHVTKIHCFWNQLLQLLRKTTNYLGKDTEFVD
jgi:hypothetical protein